MAEVSSAAALDGRARRRAQTEFHRPQVLEAGAGTGKTAALVARVLAWCVGAGWERVVHRLGEDDPELVAGGVLDGVVAITFTEDAAAEMADRVARGFSALARWDGSREPAPDWPDLEVLAGPAAKDTVGLFAGSLPADPAVVRVRAAALVAQVERLRIGTIHAFARWLVGRFPVEAGLHPAFQVDGDGRLLEALVDEVVEVELARAYREGDRDALALAAEGMGPAEVAEAARRLVELGVSADALAVDPFTEDSVAAVLGETGARLERARDVLEKLARARGKKDREIARRVLDLGSLIADRRAPPLETLRALRGTLLEIAAEAALRKWSRGKVPKSSSLGADEVGSALADLPALIRHVTLLDPERFGIRRRLLHRVLQRVDAERRRRGIVTFQDLLVRARGLLERAPAVADQVREGIEQLLVDEVQDTDSEQAAIVRLLALEGPEEARPGLLLVGDPKQSIYGWRDADLAVYEELVEAAKAAGGEVGKLVVNFRSTPPILAEVDRVVGANMTRQPGIQPEYQELIPCRAHAGRGGGEANGLAGVEHWVSVEAGPDGRPAPTSAVAAARLEAEAVADDIGRLVERLDGHLPYSEIAILLRSRSHQEVFLEALRERGIPYAVGADRSHYRTREVAEAVALVRLILDRHDVLALAAVLRSPLVGVPDVALAPLWREGLPRLMAGLGEGHPPGEELARAVRRAEAEVARLPMARDDRRLLRPLSGWPEALVRFAEQLAALRASAEGAPPDRFVEELRQRTFLEPLAAGRFPGHYRLANLERFLRELERRLLEGAGRAEVLTWLRRAAGERPEEEAGRPREDVEGVRVLTVHGAKGLGFRWVYLVQTGAGRRHGEPRLPARAARICGRWELELHGLPSPGFFRVVQRLRAVTEAERVRLLYVALTRAKERLVTAGCWSRTSRGKTVFLDLLERAPHWPEGVVELWPEPGEAEVRSHGVTWVWLGHPRYFAAEKRRRTEHPPAGGPALEREANRLAARRRWARAAMRRPFLAAVSEEAHRRLLETPARVGEEEDLEEVEEAVVAAPDAAAVGSAFHRMMERFDLAAGDPDVELERRLDEARTWLAENAGVGAGRRLEALVHEFRSGKLWPRFLELRGRVVARELPVALPPEAVPLPPEGVPLPEEERPVGAVIGAVDLVYVAEDGTPVVVDFKTDDPAAVTARLPRYRVQVTAYAEALRRALALPARPRTELWLVAAGRWVNGEPPP